MDCLTLTLTLSLSLPLSLTLTLACLASATEVAERSRWTTSDRLKPHAGWRACSAAISEASCTWPSARVQGWGWDRV